MIQQPFALPAHFSPATQPTQATTPHPDNKTSAGTITNTPRTWWFICDGANLLTTTDTADALEADLTTCTLPQAHSLSDLGMQPLRTQFLGYLNGQPCISAELKNASEHPEDLAFQNLRSLYGTLPEDLFAIAARAIQITEWDRTHQYCGHCATPMTQSPTERAKRCGSCKLRQYPRLSPAVIMLISKGDQLLLARAPRFRNGMYSVLAGFVEPGESLEETVAREVREEVGIEIKNICYFGSQPWPFPDSLMVGFTAEYASGKITPDPAEIEAADWFDKDNLPPVPGKLSIARKLIDTFVAT
ncbi:MAG: NAD(+) diphosphatase [Cyanobacteria bacterium J06598_3]